MKLKRVACFIVFTLCILCRCWVHKQVDCYFQFDLCIVNTSNDTVKVVAEKNGEFSSKVESFSFNEALLYPKADTILQINYDWEGTDGCGAGCYNENYNGNLFLVSFWKGETLLEKKRIVPCKPCDQPQDEINHIKNGEVFTDTLYYGR
jgi:hypothetical protein